MNNKIKIVYFLATLNMGGAERVTVNFIRKLDKDEYDIFLVLVDKRGELLSLIPEHVTIIDLKSKRTLFSLFKLRKILKFIEPNVVYSTLFRTHIALYFSYIGIKKRAKIVLRSPTSPKTLLQRDELNWFNKKLITYAYQSANTIIAQTPEMKEEISYFHNVDLDKIEVLLNPLDRALIDESIKEGENPFDEKDINVVTAGRLSTVKGFDILLCAFAEVLSSNKKFFLHIIGRDAGEEAFLKELSHQLNISHRVKFWGFQKNPYLFFYYSQLHVLSSRREGLPNTVLENLYLNRPIVATRCISFMETLIENGKNGLIVDVENAEMLGEAILSYSTLKSENIEYKENLEQIKKIFR